MLLLEGIHVPAFRHKAGSAVSRTRCGILHAAAQSRDRAKIQASLPGLTRQSIFFERLF
jgi:hypothetical protein